MIHAIDLDTLWPALRANRAIGAKIVYDIFDFYSPMIARRIPGWLRTYLANLERRVALRADLLLLVFQRHHAREAGRLATVERAAAHAHEQPGAHRAARGVELLRLPPDFQEDVVQQIFGLAAVAEDALADRHQAGGKPLV